jgi:transposase InsO family protein
VGEGGDEVSVARFIADQRTLYRVPVAFTCLILGVSISWFYKWIDRGPTRRQRRRAKVDAAVAAAFKASRGLHGSPRLHIDLRAKGWTVSEKTVADSMRRQGLVARIIKRRNGLTKQDKGAPRFPDLVKRDFTATAMNEKWVGDITEIPTAPVHGHRDRPVQPAAAGRRDQPPPGRAAGLRGDHDGGRGPRRPRAHQGRHLPQRPRQHLHRQELHPAVRRPARHPPEHGTRGFVLR